ncbi:MAG: AAA family ATPase [Pirellulales bacterium]
MKSITFYSYKGGTGRTLAAVNFAIYLARLGLRVVVLDMDLEAPGVDSKFHGFSLPAAQFGMLDYILDFQSANNDPGSVKRLCVDVPVNVMNERFNVGLIPAGDYLSPEYSVKLNRLDWSRIFSPDMNGVAFFQQFLSRVKEELRPDFLIVDSRTGIGEVSGVCTQQLADEVVIFTSLASECIKMTKHLAEIVASSEIASALGKQVAVKVVLSRISEPEDVSSFKAKFAQTFGVPESRLFLLFSSSELEGGEFLALAGTRRDEGLVANYIQLFHGLDIKLADESIRKQIVKTESLLLSVSPEDSEARILELTALYPHPEVYRAAMRYYRLTKKSEGVYLQGFRLLDVKPGDEEAQDLIVESFLAGRLGYGGAGFVRQRHGDVNLKRVAEIGWEVFLRGKLNPEQVLALASLMEEVGLFSWSHQAVMSVLDSRSAQEFRLRAYSLAGRTAIKIGQFEVARDLVAKIPVEQLRGQLAELAVRTLSESGGGGEAFDLALLVLNKDITVPLVTLAVELAAKLGRKPELVACLLASKDFEYLANMPHADEVLTRHGLDEVFEAVVESRSQRR